MIVRIQANARLSKCVVANGFIFLAGLTANEKAADVADETRDILRQIDGLLEQAGCSRANLIRVQIWLADIGYFDALNKEWSRWIGELPPPARATVQAQLAGGAKIEMMATAIVE